jgi:hypothetical protein
MAHLAKKTTHLAREAAHLEGVDGQKDLCEEIVCPK